MTLGINRLQYAPPPAQVVKLVDTLASGASGRMAVEVQVLSWAPSFRKPRWNPDNIEFGRVFQFYSCNFFCKPHSIFLEINSGRERILLVVPSGCQYVILEAILGVVYALFLHYPLLSALNLE